MTRYRDWESDKIPTKELTFASMDLVFAKAFNAGVPTTAHFFTQTEWDPVQDKALNTKVLFLWTEEDDDERQQ